METLSLTKDEKIDLTKTNPGLKKLNIGAGWDFKGTPFDLDLYALVLGGNQKLKESNKSVVYFGNKNSTPGGVKISDDNRTGKGDGDDETIFIDFEALNAGDVEAVIIGINIYNAGAAHFGKIQNAYVRAYNPDDNNKELLKYDLSEDYSGKTAVEVAKIYKHNGEWKFQALGEGKSGDINELTTNYR